MYIRIKSIGETPARVTLPGVGELVVHDGEVTIEGIDIPSKEAVDMPVATPPAKPSVEDFKPPCIKAETDHPSPAPLENVIKGREGYGTVLKYYPARGFGFVSDTSRPTNERIWFHITNIEDYHRSGQVFEPQVGDKFSYDVVFTPGRGWNAHNMKLDGDDISMRLY